MSFPFRPQNCLIHIIKGFPFVIRQFSIKSDRMAINTAINVIHSHKMYFFQQKWHMQCLSSPLTNYSWIDLYAVLITNTVCKASVGICQTFHFQTNSIFGQYIFMQIQTPRHQKTAELLKLTNSWSCCGPAVLPSLETDRASDEREKDISKMYFPDFSFPHDFSLHLASRLQWGGLNESEGIVDAPIVCACMPDHQCGLCCL